MDRYIKSFYHFFETLSGVVYVLFALSYIKEPLRVILHFIFFFIFFKTLLFCCMSTLLLYVFFLKRKFRSNSEARQRICVSVRDCSFRCLSTSLWFFSCYPSLEFQRLYLSLPHFLNMASTTATGPSAEEIKALTNIDEEERYLITVCRVKQIVPW